MKKTLLLVETLFVLGAVGCGAPDDAPLDDSPPSMTTSGEDLTTSGCTQLTPSSVKASGDDGAGSIATNSLDDKLDTRWSSLGKGQWIDYDLGSTKAVGAISIAWHQGNTRANTFTVSTSPDGMTYTQVYSGKSSGTTTAAETYKFTSLNTRRVRVYVQGNTVNDWASIAEARPCAGTVVTPTPGGIIWRGDFESGDRGQWDGTQMVSSDRLQVIPSPVREGGYALKATVRQGDDPINSSGNRNEIFKQTKEAVGSEYWYRWSNRFPSDFPSAKTWQLFTQWHHDGCCGSPPVEFYVYGEEMRLNIGGDPGVIVWKTPLVRNQWHDFIFHVKWSPNASVGFVELYYNGTLVLPKRFIATQYSGQLNYLKIGLYRNDTVAPVGVVYHDGWVMGRTKEDVLDANYQLK
ncbi:carbohydrate-binding protein [Corallococcus praedator]|uniref:Carbohydrate-binding protein n=1 Tax=Corallococcus praedator TaxID=2316724 RepID=A0ABX9QPD2_9BACT|nr:MULTISPECIES: heparin lyase I family protein [Corallococcus]RKH09232.1 carbohydrate-binding protein [Corallococcus sp. CA047B]RKH24538.1 carbohydrate-binding protein [Corallococcus sp. CA031C]RKI13023.1 carbohydrate-binding protein [Corallococcus praedator]